jgi:hypothetical protein
LAGETEVLGENLPHRHFLHHKSDLPDPGSNPGRRGGKPATNRLSYGTAIKLSFVPSIEEHTVVPEAETTLEVHFNLKSNVPTLKEILYFVYSFCNVLS